MGIYICSKCGSAIESQGLPQGGLCPSGGVHQWYKICGDCYIAPKSGTKPYQCNKCGVVIYVGNDYPTSAPCSTGGLHHWFRLE